MANILFLDNFDSFTYNLVDQFRVLGHNVKIYRNDCDLDQLVSTALNTPDTVLALSPGPGTPAEAGILLPLIERLKNQVPIIGICLGHQALAETFGGKLRLAKNVMHGKQSQITFESPSPIFEDIKNDVPIMRYHSIVVDQMPEEFEVTAITTDDQEIMAIQHKSLPIYGLQYHPESIGSPDGLKMIENFVKLVLD